MSRRPDLHPKLPSFSTRKPLPFREIPAPEPVQARLVDAANSYLHCYVLGECTVIVTKEWGRWHLSISHRTRYPTWDEIAEARYRIMPDGTYAALILPPKDQYVNMNTNCFQVVEVIDPHLERI